MDGNLPSRPVTSLAADRLSSNRTNNNHVTEWMFDGNKDADSRLPSRHGSAAGDYSGTSRPMTASSGRIGTAIGSHRGIPGTASRLLASAAQNRQMTRSGIGLQTPVNVHERPVTQQGLSGFRTTTTGRGPVRQYQDKSYFLGLLRAKMTEIQTETSKLAKEIDEANEEQSTYLEYDKRVKELASELTESQGILADYNLLVDKINTDTNRAEVEAEAIKLKAQNDMEWKEVETLFEEKQDKEKKIKGLEADINQERYLADNVISAMQPSLREKYLELKNQNLSYQDELERMNQELDRLNDQKTRMEEEISNSSLKRDAFALFEQLRSLEEKRNNLIREEKLRGTPAEERERLLQQVKDDNAEISLMDRQILEIQENIQRQNDEMNQIDQDLEENQSERNQKYRELKKREETMDLFLNGFQDSKDAEIGRLSELENKIQEITENMSRNISHGHQLPTESGFAIMKDDLAFKQDEMEKSKYTLDGLNKEHRQLQGNLEKMGALEDKIKSEMVSLKDKMKQMEDEMIVFRDLDRLKVDAEEKRDFLDKQSTELSQRRIVVAQNLADMKTKYDEIKKQLGENETHTQLTNFERKLSHLEQNNFTVKEFICNKKAELDIGPIKSSVMKLQREYNKKLILSMKKTP
ncbi:intraflagellar transport protein 74 homolog isoform X2 [Lepeophtheirus salmonis]|uniref:intraflagellar transport protein 74 homolog isoform X2 n=1 Tax=Lepeophtheirus salmonis TaxID=72036 RepID=UPI001AE8DE3B|nr:intraflagellar transport protein 74 homolog isoform X2 [Lepeophtheirus salmonis]